MTIEYRQERQDVTAAKRVLLRPVWGFLVACFVFTLILDAGNISHAARDGSFAEVFAACLPAALLGLFLVFLGWVSPHISARRAILRSLTWTLTDEKIQVRTEVSSSEMQWQAFIKWKETKTLFLLFVQRGQAQFLPKRVLNESQVNELRALIAAHVKKG